MEEIKRQVSAAQRRLVMQQFLVIATWALFVCLIVTAVGLAIPKIWPLDIDSRIWIWSWVGGGCALGFLAAIVWTLIVRHDSLVAAIEIDHRFGLKERVSSTLALSDEDRSSEAGQALVSDTIHQVQRIDVRDSFPVRGSWRTLLPLLPAIAIFVLIAAVPDATREKQAAASLVKSADAEQINRSAKQLQKRLARAEKKIQEKNLTDAEVLLKELRAGIDELTRKSTLNRKDALVRMNNLAETLEQRRDKLGGIDKVRQQLNQLNNMQQGPADKIAKAMKDGDFGKALEELKKLQDKLEAGELNDEEKKQLMDQLEKVRQKLNDMVDAHQEAKRKLEEEIQRREAAGDREGAGKLQRQLDQLNSMNDQMSQLEQMANNLGQCGECLRNGDGQQAAAQLGEAAQQLEQLQQELDELETLDEMLEGIAAAKEAMNCQACQGQGCEACMGGFGAGDQGNGFGMGEGQGQGDRPEERNQTGMYETQVRGDLQPGQAVRSGYAGGPNRAGRTMQEVKELIGSNLSEDADPLTEHRLPRKEREHAMEYFRRFRSGE